MGKIKEDNLKLVDRDRLYSSKEAVDILVSCKPLKFDQSVDIAVNLGCLLYTSPSPRDGLLPRMPSSV